MAMVVRRRGPTSSRAKDPASPKNFPEIFPFANVHRWQPVKKDLKGKVAEAVEYIILELQRRPCAHISFREVMKHIGWNNSKDFKRHIRRHHDFIDALAAEGIDEAGRGKRPTGFERVAS